MTNLSKAFDCINLNLLIANFHASGFKIPPINFIYSFLTKRKQRTKVDFVVSSRETLFSGVPQGSILGTFLTILFIITQMQYVFEIPANIDFAGYGDGNTPYTYSSNKENVLDNVKCFIGFQQITC